MNERRKGGRELTIGTDIVGLNVNALDLTTFDNESVALATIVAEEGGRGELDVQSTAEGTAGVGEEADAAGLVSVERLAPGAHAM